MGRRAEHKKMRRKVKVGDTVTWGRGVLNHKVLEVHSDGVVVDAESEGFPRLFVTWEGGRRGRGRGPGLAPISKVRGE